MTTLSLVWWAHTWPDWAPFFNWVTGNLQSMSTWGQPITFLVDSKTEHTVVIWTIASLSEKGYNHLGSWVFWLLLLLPGTNLQPERTSDYTWVPLLDGVPNPTPGERYPILLSDHHYLLSEAICFSVPPAPQSHFLLAVMVAQEGKWQLMDIHALSLSLDH